jgi:uncharacterized protein YbjT (DUF2867 family)
MPVILVTGASGNVGRALVGELRDLGIDFRAMTRDPRRRAFPGDVQVVQGDLDDAASLHAALENVDQIFLLTRAQRLRDHAANLCGAARKHPVRRIVLLSSSAVEMADANPLAREHAEAEEILIASGLEWTMLRPGPFSSNTAAWANSIRTAGIVRSLFGNAPGAPIDVRDIAAVARHVLTSDGHVTRSYSLTGPEQLTPAEQTQIIGNVIGRDLSFEVPSIAEATVAMAQIYSDPIEAEAVVRTLRRSDLPWTWPLPTVKELTGEGPRTFQTWVEENRALFQ